jgi:hypothetical protein
VADVPIIHVGFAHSGTKSLQQNIFSVRPDLFYVGIPYEELGGIFSGIKYLEPEAYSYAATSRHCRELIFSKMRPDQRLVISDETLVEQPAIYYTPPPMPISMIAQRLRALFGSAIVLFTLRNQLHYVISDYLILKANYATLANQIIEPFDAWFAGNQSQTRNLFLRNLDPSRAIKVYQRVFGAEAVRVLPLELLQRHGTATYLDHLGEMTGLEFSAAEAEAYVARNTSPPHGIVLTEEQREIIHRHAMEGNAFVAETFKLPLRDFGYPMPTG